ncbi:MAG: hypothetical protein WCH40_13260, partial [Verrucomicrobiales bacterium]
IIHFWGLLVGLFPGFTPRAIHFRHNLILQTFGDKRHDRWVKGIRYHAVLLGVGLVFLPIARCHGCCSDHMS